METDRNLLTGVLALQAGLIDSKQFVEICTLWTTRKKASLTDLLIERGWILAADVAPIEYLLKRNLERHGGDAAATLMAARDDVKRQLADLNDAEIQGCLTNLARSKDPNSTLTLDLMLQPRDRYTRTRLHAIGGIGQIWVAHDHQLGRDIALKQLRSDKPGSDMLLRRFLREARITAQLEHPGIVPVYQLAESLQNQQPFYTMRLVKGRTLTEAARAYHKTRTQGQANLLEFLSLLNSFVAVCNTIAYAHSRDIIHRDLKGQNVVLGDFGEVVVLDWGLAKMVDRIDLEYDAASTVDQVASEDVDLTIEGEMIGTPAYMAPEQALGSLGLIDRRTDVYGLGAILYEILTGKCPFAGADAQEVLLKVRKEEPLPPHEFWPDVPSALETACLRALRKTPGDRHSSAIELAHEVQNWQEVQRRHAEEELDRFFNLSIDMLCVAGFDGHMKRMNSAFSRILGFTIEELCAEPYINFVHPDDRAATVAEAKRLVGAGVNAIFFENRYRCKDGSYRWMQWTATPDFDQQLIYAAARDITEPRRIQEALGESEERYRSVISAMQNGIVILDSNGAIRTCNASAERILGLSAEQMMGRTSLDPRWRAIHEDGSPFPGDTFPAAVTLRTGQPCSDVVMGVYKPDGELTWISINSQPLFRPDQVRLAGVVASFSDITAHKRTEDLLKETTSRLAEANPSCRK